MSLKPSRIDSVSIIVVNYNAGSMLNDCVERCLKQAGEVIIVDNASLDDSMRMLESSFASDSHLKVIQNSKNLGFAAACNIGSEAASGKYLLYLNPDALLQENAVVKLVSGFGIHPDIGMTGALLLNPDGTEQAGGRRAVPTPWRSFVRTFHLYRLADRWPTLFFDFYLHMQPLPDEPVEVEAISGACMMIKREAMEQVDYWDDDYFLHCEDLDLCMRLRQKGWKILFIPDAPVIHYVGLCSHSRRIFVEWHKHKGMMRFYRKFFRHQYPGALMWLVAVGVWIRFAGVALYHTVHRIGRWLSFAHR